MKPLLFFFGFLFFPNLCFSFNANYSELKEIDWNNVLKQYDTVTSSVNEATNSWEPALNALELGGNILGSVGSIVSFAKFLFGLTQPGPEKQILEKLDQLEKTIIEGFKRLGEKMDMGFNQILHHIDKADYRQKVIDEIRPLWEKFLILSNHPNMTDALHKFVRACEDHKPEETLGNMLERISIEPSILTSLKQASFYEWKSFESFSSSALQQLTQLEIVFGYCELIANNLTNIDESSSKEMFEIKLKKLATAIKESENDLKQNFPFQNTASLVVKKCIAEYGIEDDKETRCIVQKMKEIYSWTNFNLCKINLLHWSTCDADCPAKVEIHSDVFFHYLITDLNRINDCPTGLCIDPCVWKDNNTATALEDYLPSYLNAFEQQKPYPYHSKTHKSKPKRYRKRPHVRIEISYPLNGEEFIASFFTKKNFKNY